MSVCSAFVMVTTVVENEQVRDEMVVLDHFPLFIPRVFRQQAASAEGDPLHKQVERLAFVRRRLNRPSEFNVQYTLKRYSGTLA
jgi:hypothetical protein